MLVRISLLTFFLTLFSSGFAMAERRVALVMGNSNYQNTISLLNPATDAKEMSKLLRSVGFEVITGTDLSQREMTSKLSEFARLSQNADVALFFYAGHGIQVNAKNYLIPIDANLTSEMDAEFKAIKTSLVLHMAMAGAKSKIMLLDACRDNPFVKSIARSLPRTRSTAVAAGLARMSTGEGTLIAFATSPGQVALDGDDTKHSPFTGALLKYLAKPGLEIDHALKFVGAEVQNVTNKQQQPWVTTNMTKLLYLNKTAPKAATLPNAKLASLSPSNIASPTKIQPQATAQNNFDPRQLEAAKLRQETAIWQAAQSSNTIADYQQYLTQYPSGAFAGFAASRMASLKNPTPARTRTVAVVPPYAPKIAPQIPAPQNVSISPAQINPALRTTESSESMEDALGLQRASWQQVQRKLTRLGFSTRGINGSIGKGTRRAIRNWQTRRGYSISGFLNKLQHEALLLEQPPAHTPNYGKKTKRGKKARKGRRTARRVTKRKKGRSSRGRGRGRRNGLPSGRQIRRILRTGKRLGFF